MYRFRKILHAPSWKQCVTGGTEMHSLTGQKPNLWLMQNCIKVTLLYFYSWGSLQKVIIFWIGILLGGDKEDQLAWPGILLWSTNLGHFNLGVSGKPKIENLASGAPESKMVLMRKGFLGHFT